MTALIVASANVNGVRAAVRRGMGPWLAERAPDVQRWSDHAPVVVTYDLAELQAAADAAVFQGWSARRSNPAPALRRMG